MLIIKRITNRPIIRDTFITTTLGIIGRSAGLLIPFFISAWFGISKDTDAFFFVLGILVFFSGVFAWAIESVIVPYIAKLESDGSEIIGKFVGSLLLSCWVFLLVTICFLLFAAKPILLFTTNFSHYSINTIWGLLVEISPVILLITASGILGGVLNAYKLFGYPAFSTTLSLIIIILIAYLFKDTYGVHAIVLGYIIGEAFRFVFLLLKFRQANIGQIVLSFQQKKLVYDFYKISVFMIIGMCIAGLPPIINRAIASHFGIGGVSIVEYAEKMFYIPAGVIGSGFLTVVLSYWSDVFHNRGAKELWNGVIRVTKLMVLISFFSTVLLFIFRFQLTSLAIGWGKIPETEIKEVAQLFGIYLLGLIPNILNLILVRAHLVLKNTVNLMKATFVGVGMLLLFNAIITPYIGLMGIALSLTGFQVAVSLFLFITLKKSLKI